jgi:hypothetical protein
MIQSLSCYISLIHLSLYLPHIRKICLAAAMEATRERGSIAPTHYWPQHQVGVSGQNHVPAVLYPGERTPQQSLDRKLGGPQSWSGHRGLRKNPLPPPGIKLWSPIILNIEYVCFSNHSPLSAYVYGWPTAVILTWHLSNMLSFSGI